eukprot:9373147-Ditylum_brightwellii.AAC.1
MKFYCEMHGQNKTHDTGNCFVLNQRKKCAKSDTSWSETDKVSYKDLNAFVNTKVMATLNQAKKNQKKKKEKEVEINAFNKFCSFNIESSDKEGKLKKSTPTADDNNNSDASRLLSNDSNSDVST